MQCVQRDEIVDFLTYDDRRAETRADVLTIKSSRRVHVGEYLTFLFENADTVRYQIHEMLRAERIVREADIQREIDTYNELLGSEGELGACLFIEIDSKEERDVKLRAWRDLVNHIYMRFEDGTTTRALYDERQVGDDKLSAVQYLKFAVGGRVPIALGSDLPALAIEVELGEQQRAALLSDLSA
jgi:hypothetical protein